MLMSKGMDVPANGGTHHESSYRIVLFNGLLRVVLLHCRTPHLHDWLWGAALGMHMQGGWKHRLWGRRSDAQH
ncbi:hypothetical protein HZ326_0503 [Fusarium oxysporum f. sp. albedinis]|nr:hypothetical protein HZ326_0503 [Fusarium oxysporum f. sp. albedinis]